MNQREALERVLLWGKKATVTDQIQCNYGDFVNVVYFNTVSTDGKPLFKQKKQLNTL